MKQPVRGECNRGERDRRAGAASTIGGRIPMSRKCRGS